MKKLTALICLIALLLVGCGKQPLTVSVTGMGTVISLSLYGGTTGDAQNLLALFEEIEQASSLTIAASAANKLNETGQTENAHLLSQAQTAAAVYAASAGAMDLTVGSLTALWHIGFPDARVPSQEEIAEALTRVNGADVTVTETSLTLKNGQKADFGAITKGYACDQARELLEQSGVSAAVVAVGGSLLFYGSPGRDWVAAIRHPEQENAYAGTFTLKEGCVSTSGAYERFLEAEGKTYHHILDPSTGYPAESDLLSVTVVSSSGALSDALSTACFVLGAEKGAALLNAFGAQGVFILKDHTVKVFGLDFTLTGEGLTR